MADINDILLNYKNIHGNVKNIVDVGIQKSTDFLINVFPECHHDLFEPVIEYNSEILENYKNISHTLINKAVSNVNNIETISIFERSPEFSDIVRTIEIEHITLDSYFSKNNSGIAGLNTVVKLDVDGTEPLIIEGGRRFLSKVGLLIVEANVNNIGRIIQQVNLLNLSLWDIGSMRTYNNQLCECDLFFINGVLRKPGEQFELYPKNKEWDWKKYQARGYYDI